MKTKCNSTAMKKSNTSMKHPEKTKKMMVRAKIEKKKEYKDKKK